jgi:hypothetical protein
MTKDAVVTINGQQYDAITGMPVSGSDSRIKKAASAGSIHSSIQRSKTLIRRVTKKPSPVSNHRPKHPGQTMDIARSSKVIRFAPHPVIVAAVSASTPDLPVAAHPLLSRAHKIHGGRKQSPVPIAKKSTQEIKNDAITAALAKPPVKQARKRFFNRHPRAITIIIASIVVAVLAGYLTYVNLPTFSVSVADASAGIHATYPTFVPDGYSLDGGPQWSAGQVTLNFIANAGTSKFTLTQTKSSWDSPAVLSNIVIKDAGNQYITNQEQGLTIYTYGTGDAAWVNGGLLYTVKGNAPLSGEQVRQIAISM